MIVGVGIGEAAALATALLWAMSALCWGVAGKRIGAVAVTCLRTTLAAVILLVIQWIVMGSLWPVGMRTDAVVALAASGAIGAGVGDMLFFRGLVLIGPRLGMLILSLAPILTAVIAYFALGERLGAWAIVGIIMTVGGVAWVVAEPRQSSGWQGPRGKFGQGVLVSVLGTVCVAVGFVLSKLGMTDQPGAPGIAPFPGTVIRLLAATPATWLSAVLLGMVGSTVQAVRDRRAMLVLLCGTIVGPVVGIWMSMVAMQSLPTGVANALIATSPIMMIPMAYLAFRERPSLRAIAGTVLAVAGVFILLLLKPG